MQLFNPTNTDITVQIKGVKYTAPANGFVKNVPKEHAEYWMTVHPFLASSEEEVVVEENKEIIEVNVKPKEEVEKPKSKKAKK